MDKIELKVKKLLAMINDRAATENEKLIATNGGSTSIRVTRCKRGEIR